MPGWGQTPWGESFGDPGAGVNGTGLVEGVFATGFVNELTAIKIVILPGFAGSAPPQFSPRAVDPPKAQSLRVDPPKPKLSFRTDKPKPKPVREPVRINGTAIIRGVDCIGYVNDLEAVGESVALVAGISAVGITGKLGTQATAAILGMDRELEEAAEWFVLNVA